MKKIDEQKLKEYQRMNRVQDLVDSIEGGNVIDTKVLNMQKIKDALDFLRSLREKNEFELIASENATVKAMAYLSEIEVYVEECVIQAHNERDLLTKQLQEARECSVNTFETIIKPKLQEITEALKKMQKMPLPRTHRADAFSPVKDDFLKEIKIVTDLIGITYSR